MYRISLYILAILALVVGLLIGALNSDSVSIDLFWTQLELPLGATLVIAFVVGVLLGLFTLYVFRVLPIGILLRRTRKKLRKLESPSTGIDPDAARLPVSED